MQPLVKRRSARLASQIPARPLFLSPLNLLPLDLRRLLRGLYLDQEDMALYRAALGLPFAPTEAFIKAATKKGHLGLLQWAWEPKWALTRDLFNKGCEERSPRCTGLAA